ncbi:hypothetical protein Q3G72_035110 [Acer saccharum]|nr:hypothetical protein Q3G72_035110 [Acer saccharum]
MLDQRDLGLDTSSSTSSAASTWLLGHVFFIWSNSMDLAAWARLLHLEQQYGLGCLGTSLPVSLILKLCYFYYFLCYWFVCVSGFLSMVSPSMLGLVEDPIVLDATLCSSSHTSVPICGGGSVSNSGGFRLGNVLPTASALCDILLIGDLFL